MKSIMRFFASSVAAIFSSAGVLSIFKRFVGLGLVGEVAHG